VEDLYPIPNEILVITMGIDTQDDRIEGTVTGWTEDGTSYVLDYKIFHGDPVKKEVWDGLTEFLDTTYTRADDIELGIKCTTIDSGGHKTQNVYAYAKKMMHKRVFAIKGVNNNENEPILVGKPSTSNNLKIQLYKVGTFGAKELLFSKLKIDQLDEGSIHFNSAVCDEEYFAQLTAEKLVTSFSKGFPKRTWKKIRARNEALDTWIYSLAALHILKPNFKLIKESIDTNQPTVKDIINKNKRKEKSEINKENEQAEEVSKKPIAQHKKKIQPTRRPKRGGFVKGWK
jgi:phage terminase large subunit GpA-like protein